MRRWGYILGYLADRLTQIPPMPLSDLAIRRAKPTDRPQKLSDGGGLYLMVAVNGGRYWRWKYRFAGKEKLLAIGVYPEVPLALARQRREEARQLLAQGIDPGEHKKAAAAARAMLGANTFEVIANEWLEKRSWVEGYRVKVVGWFKNDVFPYIGARPAAELDAPEFLAVARRIEKRGAFESAHRIMQNCGQVMRYAIATGRASRNPVADLRGALAPAPQRHHPAVTDPRELGQLLRAIDGYMGSPITRCALALAPMVFVRPGELRQAEWSEFDLDAARWSIPEVRMKMRQPHLVPLSRQALAVLAELQPLTGQGRYVFPSARTAKRPMSDNALNAALRRMGYEVGTVTGHGFRATARTILDEVLGFRPDIIEHQLAHAVKDPNGRAYNRTTHLGERVRMMQRWADYMDELRSLN
ncbi:MULTISPECIES: tyrosine-type recombinase/integrase [Xanthomonas]|uniref:tyrosine-type recombinase/integrase n=1 Tax=Xanthomonas TaxID=338 RepID=UPI001AD9BCF3|nr:integrase arm-type DNA-binding domain-containing protein [Xanthomonas phaseoli]MBO9766536.1 integrase arm-type DNA-binding domain-containing protein [Xanthomonas phaseoli pv. dieffenbachiae]MBO9776118.1 integrase arm-type DNA-binding domain-containing protein [Xanthomonas phaseoli pv. dieffenbachiae]MBO9778283.1 integrase arm-type DNA-binding domain-containing protein [Xanthomonas phaseoli pv. dieffenbachiae]MBO9795329.1 integrase arm-type DNA-binding domain-containing protein [Xanthomonas p